ncbi:MAG: MFS transporter [Spirochaetia bacterium]|nr:MFS transporter [Spirochaetia bacterium]
MNKTDKTEQLFIRDVQYYKFCAYGFLKNLKFFEPFLLLFFLEKGITFLQIGTLYASREALINVFEIPSGIVADSIGRRKVMALSLLSYILSFIIFFFSQSYLLLLGAMFFFAIGEAFRTGTHKAMIFTYLKENSMLDLKALYYGHTRSWSQIGSAISALIAAALVFYSGSYAPIFLFTIIPYVADFFLILSYPKSFDEYTSHKEKTIPQIFKEVFKGLIVSFKNITLLKGIGNQAVYSGYYKAVKDYIQPIIKSVALSLPFFIKADQSKRTAFTTGVIYFVIYFLTSFASKYSHQLSNRFSSPEKALNSYLFIGVFFGAVSALFYYAHLPLIAVVFFLMIYMIENLRKPIGIAYVTSLMDEVALASLLSVESQAETGFAVVFSLLIGILTTIFSLPIALFSVSIILLVLSLFLRLKEVK